MSVIDASVYVSLVSPHEDAHDRTRSWFEAFLRSGGTLYAPVIILGEVAAAIGRGQGDSERAQNVADALRRSYMIQLHAVSLTLADRAAAIAARQQIRGCDALYVALAEALNEDLVTLDRQQQKRGAAVVTTRSP